MATLTQRNVQVFPAMSDGASGATVIALAFDDGTEQVTITPGSDGALPPGVATEGAGVTLQAVPAAPATPDAPAVPE